MLDPLVQQGLENLGKTEVEVVAGEVVVAETEVEEPVHKPGPALLQKTPSMTGQTVWCLIYKNFLFSHRWMS